MKKLMLVALLVLSATAAEAGPIKATGKAIAKGGKAVASGTVKGVVFVGKGLSKIF